MKNQVNKCNEKEVSPRQIHIEKGRFFTDSKNVFLTIECNIVIVTLIRAAVRVKQISM